MKIYLTFDMDWAPDEVIEYTLNILSEYNRGGVRATFNVTNESILLEEMLDMGHELGIHPNFNNLLNGGTGSYRQVIQNIKEVVPNAVTARSHSLVSGSPIRQVFRENGIKYELNTIVEPLKGMKLYPWKFNDVWQIPFIFEDDLYLSFENFQQNVDWLISEEYDAPRVINFHPVHVFLNTENIARYEKAKVFLHDVKELSTYRNKKISFGVEAFLRELIERCLEKGNAFETICSMGNDMA